MNHQRPQKPKQSVPVNLLWLGLVSLPTPPTKSLLVSVEKLYANLKELEDGHNALDMSNRRIRQRSGSLINHLPDHS